MDVHIAKLLRAFKAGDPTVLPALYAALQRVDESEPLWCDHEWGSWSHGSTLAGRDRNADWRSCRRCFVVALHDCYAAPECKLWEGHEPAGETVTRTELGGEAPAAPRGQFVRGQGERLWWQSEDGLMTEIREDPSLRPDQPPVLEFKRAAGDLAPTAHDHPQL